MTGIPGETYSRKKELGSLSIASIRETRPPPSSLVSHDASSSRFTTVSRETLAAPVLGSLGIAPRTPTPRTPRPLCAPPAPALGPGPIESSVGQQTESRRFCPPRHPPAPPRRDTRTRGAPRDG